MWVTMEKSDLQQLGEESFLCGRDQLNDAVWKCLYLYECLYEWAIVFMRAYGENPRVGYI